MILFLCAIFSVGVGQDALNRFLEADNPLVRLMLDEVARILRAYKELRDSRLNDVLEVRMGSKMYEDGEGVDVRVYSKTAVSSSFPDNSHTLI